MREIYCLYSKSKLILPRLSVELHPTGEVSEYSATIAYELLMEGEEGNQKVDAVKMVLRAEGKTFKM